MIQEIEYLAGTSSGAQTAALLCCGYNSNELKEALKNAPWEKILNGKLFSFKGINSPTPKADKSLAIPLTPKQSPLFGVISISITGSSIPK